MTLAVAAFVDPKQAGVYSLAMLVLGFTQAASETTLRQVGTSLAVTSAGQRVLHKYALVLAILAATIVAGFLFVLAMSGVTSARTALLLAPLVIVALSYGFSAPRIVQAQVSNEWARIARSQFASSAVSLIIGLALVREVGIGAASTQSLVAEVGFWVLLPRRRLQVTAEAAVLPRDLLTVRPVLANNVLGWLQGQVDRLVAAPLVSISLFAYYSLAQQIARTPSDAVMLGGINVLRRDLSTSPLEKSLVVLGRYVTRMGIAAIALALVIAVLTEALLAPVLGPKWSESTGVVPLLASAVPLLVGEWALSTYLIVTGQSKSLVAWQVLGLLLSGLAGLVLSYGLVYACGLIVLRELAGLVGRTWLIRRDLDRRLVGVISVLILSSVIFAMLSLVYLEVRRQT